MQKVVWHFSRYHDKTHKKWSVNGSWQLKGRVNSSDFTRVLCGLSSQVIYLYGLDNCLDRCQNSLSTNIKGATYGSYGRMCDGKQNMVQVSGTFVRQCRFTYCTSSMARGLQRCTERARRSSRETSRASSTGLTVRPRYSMHVGGC